MKALRIIYQVLKLAFLVSSTFLLLAILFVSYPVIIDIFPLVPYVEYIAPLYFILGLVWIIAFYIKVVKIIKTMEPIALGIIAIPVVVGMLSILGHQQFGWDYWIGGSIIGIPLALMGIAYLVLIILKKWKK